MYEQFTPLTPPSASAPPTPAPIPTTPRTPARANPPIASRDGARDVPSARASS